jgi:GTP-binding protein
MELRKDIRNIAIIAHVDHGKTTLVDQMLWQSGIFRANEQVAERVMDSNDLERERGITILAKNTAVVYKGVKINIVDTPGHADFGGEVERILTMVDGVLLLVDAFEGCMPQTRFVMMKALALGKQPILVVNKIDRPGARPEEVIDEVLDMLIELGAEEHQLEYPVVYASAREGWATLERGGTASDLEALFETIIDHVPPPRGRSDAPLQILFCTVDHDDYIGRIGVGRVERGTASLGQQCVLCKSDGTQVPVKITRLYQFQGLKRTEVDGARLGDIVAVAGLGSVGIGETLCDAACVEPLPFVNIDEPTIAMVFSVNNSPFAGREGRYVTSRNLRERLFKEVETNLSMRVKETGSPDSFEVSGRGELHLSILIETMRREGYEFQVSRPRAIYKQIDGVLSEPVELLVIHVTEQYMGPVMEKLGQRQADLLDMAPDDQGAIRLDFQIPSRALMGYRTEFMTDTRGNGIMHHVFSGYEPCKKEMSGRSRGSMVAFETGEATTYGLFNAQERGDLFATPGMRVYEGMIVGQNAKSDDLVVNVCKKKHITNMRASGSDEALKLTPPIVFSLEQALEFIADDELVEITPENIRLRKMVLSKEQRLKSLKKDSES